MTDLAGVAVGEFYDGPDVFEAADEVAESCADTPFPQIWVYVGFFSSDDGRNAEFSLTPLRASPEQWQRLLKLAGERGIDEHGRVVWQSLTRFLMILRLRTSVCWSSDACIHRYST